MDASGQQDSTLPQEPSVICKGHSVRNEQPELGQNIMQNSILHRLPPEVLIEVMEFLPVPDLYYLRQTSKLFIVMFSHSAFSRLHKFRWSSNLSSVDNLNGIAPTKPAAFDDQRLSVLEKEEIANRLRRVSLCGQCSSRPPKPEGFFCPGTRRCLDCGFFHERSWFSEGSENPATQTCIPREGRFRLCPHYKFSLDLPLWEYEASDLLKPVAYFTCQYCFPTINAAGGEAPGLYYRPRNSLVAQWKLPVYKIAPGEVITKENLRQALLRLQAFSDLLCPHISFDDDFFMMPFETSYCTCFQDPSDEGSRWQEHFGAELFCVCCACRGRLEGSSISEFMRGDRDGSYHQQKCFGCSAVYYWAIEDYQVLLSKRQYILDMSTSHVWGSRLKLEPVLTETSLSCWAACLDPSTFRGNDATRSEAFCHRVRCSNSLPASLSRWNDKCGWRRTLSKKHRFSGTSELGVGALPDWRNRTITGLLADLAPVPPSVLQNTV